MKPFDKKTKVESGNSFVSGDVVDYEGKKAKVLSYVGKGYYKIQLNLNGKIIRISVHYNMLNNKIMQPLKLF